MKIVINTRYGGFGLSERALKYYNELSGSDYKWADNISRDDPYLIQVVEELDKMANSNYADLKIIDIPDDVEWQIEEYDGREWIAEKHRTWR